VILVISSFCIWRTTEDFYPFRLNIVECPDIGLGHEGIDSASDSNAITGQDLKHVVARTDSADAIDEIPALSRFEARDNHRRSRGWRYSRGTSYRPRSIRDESVLLSMDDQAVAGISVVGDTERSVRGVPEATGMVECGFGTFMDICSKGHSSSAIAEEGAREPANELPEIISECGSMIIGVGDWQPEKQNLESISIALVAWTAIKSLP
jgi:hypothetical protein